ncbi:hypothetical protein RB653_008859 [Dictyostelium firmibasis]|uniref:Uncharacterized protein n=1 Tax=Dictyostelium firmibasis TaxID=79012 RepID=A0AAN7U5C9_9MYCE
MLNMRIDMTDWNVNHFFCAVFFFKVHQEQDLHVNLNFEIADL